jgi:hypothetical protein
LRICWKRAVLLQERKKIMKLISRLFLSAVIWGMLIIALSSFAGAASPARAQNPNAASSPSALLPNTASTGDGISISYPNGWSVTQPTTNTWAIVNEPADQQETVTPSVRLVIGYLARPDHADAVSHLAEYANGSSNPSTFLAIGGWPALQRVQLIERPQPGEELPRNPDEQMVDITTAVAAGNLVVRVDAGLPSDADQALKDLVLAIGQSLVFSSTGDPAQVQQELNNLRSLPQRPAVLRSAAAPPASAPLLPNLLQAAPIFNAFQFPPFFTFANSEPEVAVSSNGTNILVAMQGQSYASVDGGRTFSSGPVPLGIASGDSSVAIGQSGNFYHAGLFGGSCPAANNCVEIAALTVTNSGGTAVQNIGTLFNAYTCPNTGANSCLVDQEHIAADRVNAAANNLDKVYAALRVFPPPGGTFVLSVVCSPDSGAHWSPPFTLEGGSDFPRVAVGSDGSFYAVYANGGNIKIDKFNPCPALNTTTVPPTVPVMARFPQPPPPTTATPYPKIASVSGFTQFAGCGQPNGFGGLDRCNNGNILSSPTVTVDDTNANHIYVAWANNTAANNDNIVVADSVSDAAFGPSVQINAGGTARRFMPWACATGGKAFVTWYDRRAATAANNDLTDYFAASAGLNAANTLVPSNDEFKISTASDPECVAWPFTPRSRYDVLNCSPPVPGIGAGTLAGVCKVPNPPNPDNISSNRPCNYSQTDAIACPITPAITQQELCQSNGGGGPKYGDYTGNACGLGRLFTVFSSGFTAGITDNFFNSFVVTPTPTALTFSGVTTGDFDDLVTLSGTLTLSGTSSGVPGQQVTFHVGGQNCPQLTDGTGTVKCLFTPNQPPGSYPITVTFAGSGNFQPSSQPGGTFVITKEETLMTPLSQSLISRGGTESFSARLQEDLPTPNPIAGRAVNFTLSSGAASQSCTSSPLTDANGFASCSVTPVTLPLGPATVTASFAGDTFYKPISAPQNVFITSPGLPNGWIDQDIGSPGKAGSASFNTGTGTFTVIGGGTDIFDVPDQFHYIYQNGLTGDMSIKAHVETQTVTDPLAKAGVTIRETTDPASTYVDVVVTPGDGVKMEVRSLTGGASSQIGRISSVHAPYWVLLVRTGNTFTGFASADNKHWTRLGTVDVSMAPNVNVGMAVTAHDNDDLSTATFDHVLLTTPVYRVNSGDAAVPPFSADQFFSGGATKTTTATISLDRAPNPAPMAVYQSERFGVDTTGNDAPFTYTFPNLIPGFQYLVRLHFAEITFTSQDRRLFNVTINTTQVLTNFDIVEAAGAPNTANVQEFIATADLNGNITITYSHGTANHAKSSGIEIATIH